MLPEAIRTLRRAAYEHAFGRRIVDACTRILLARPRRILFGPGRGLIFDGRQEGLPGQMLGTTDLEEQRALASLLQPGQIFYDIGANIGFYAIIGAKLAGPAGKVYAFEPISASSSVLQRNCSLNGFENVVVISKAVSDADATLQFAVDPRSSQLSKIAAAPASVNGAQTFPVEAARIDTLLQDSSMLPPDVIMLDVEGHELAALRGMKETIARFKPHLLVEIHDTGPDFFAFAAEFLTPLGYTVSRIDGHPSSETGGRFHVKAVASSQ